MEVAQVIVQLAAHKEVIDAEVARVDADIDFMKTAKAKYEPASGPKELGGGAKNFSPALKQLVALKKEKQKLSEEIRQQLDLYQLHMKSGSTLLRKLNKIQQTSSGNVEIGNPLPVNNVSVQF